MDHPGKNPSLPRRKLEFSKTTGTSLGLLVRSVVVLGVHIGVLLFKETAK